MLRRHIAAAVERAVAQFPAVVLTGPRQSGKTTLARELFPKFSYISLEDPDQRAFAQGDINGFLTPHETHRGLILDEVQRVPLILSALQRRLDERRMGPVLLTGSQNLLMMEGVGQSLAGRVALFELLPLSVAELAHRPPRSPESLLEPSTSVAPAVARDELLFRGLFPRLHDQAMNATLWLDGYLRTYVERDVRSLANIGDLDTFIRFIGLCAGRSGQLVNTSSLGADAGISHVTAKKWLSLLEASYVIALLRPHHANFSKRLIKAPKMHFLDTGLMCRLLGLRKAEDLRVHPLRGAVFESYVVAELRKLFLNRGERPPLFFFRDSNGCEVDIIVDLGVRRIPIEVKSGETIADDFFKSVDAYQALSGDAAGVVVFGGASSGRRRQHAVKAWWDIG